MVDPSQLFKVLAKYQDKNQHEKTPAKHVAENFDIFFNTNESRYSKILQTTKNIDINSKNKKEDLANFIQGVVLATPYDLGEYLTHVNNSANSKYTSISLAINSWLETQFKENHPDLFNKLNLLGYVNTNTPFEIKSSRNPWEIQRFVQRTNSCLTDSPLSFFDEMTKDAGTIYLLAAQRAQKRKSKEEHNPLPNAGFAILNAFQDETKKGTLLSVDTMWINKNSNNKELLCSMLGSLVELSDYLNIPIIDKTMSNNYLRGHSNTLDIYEQQNDLFKLGHIPMMTRYNKISISKHNDGYFLIKKPKDCK